MSLVRKDAGCHPLQAFPKRPGVPMALQTSTMLFPAILLPIPCLFFPVWSICISRKLSWQE
jgi:hypothetical protein